MPASSTRNRVVLSMLATLAMVALLGSAATAAHAGGTIKALKGGDRKVDEPGNRAYALPVAGALFEYTISDAKAADPASTGWTAFPATSNASGAATVDVPAGTYYVRERTVPSGFANFGPVKSLYFNPSSDVPTSARPYVAKVKVENGQVTEAYPNRSASTNTDDWDKTYAGDSGSPFVNVRDNAAFPGSCGINILLVLDRSGSIEPFKSTYRDAAKAFVSAHDGTPTQIGILSFSAGSSGVNSYQDGSGSSSLTHSPLDLGAAGSATALNATIDNVYASPGGGTNWDRALQKASQAKGFTPDAATGQTASPDVVMFITDGNPTARSTDGSDSGSDVDLIDLTAGMASANLIKSQPARALTKLKLFALGVGSGVTADNLKAVSGPVAGEDYETPTVAQLTAKLKELAARTCGARIFVRKRVAGGAADQADWGFTATSNGGAVSYLDGNNRTHATTGNGVETGVILTQLPAGGREVTLTEDATGQPLADFKLDAVSCRTGGYDGAPVTPLATPTLGVKLVVQRGSTIYCTFTNSPAKPDLTVTKTPDHATIDAGQDAVFTIVVANRGDGVARSVTLSDQLPAPGAGGWVVAQQPAQGTCSVSAAQLLTCTGLGDLAKGQSRTVKVKTGTSNDACATYDNPAATASAGNHPPVSDGGRITCRKDALIKVIKEGTVKAHHGDTLTYTFDVSNAGNSSLHDVVVTDDRCAPVTRVSGDALLDPGEHWTYSCSYKAPAQHAAGEEDPIVNTATAAAKDEHGRPVSATDEHSTDLLHPGIEIDKQVDRATAHVGDKLGYGFVVTNAGDTPLTVAFSDPRCDAGTLSGPTGDADADGLLDVDETWTYACSHVVAESDPNPLPNTATVTGTDELGGADTDDDSTSVEILKPGALVVKEGNQFAYPGDTVTFTFAVTNTGNAPLSDVAVTDDRCAPVTRATGDDLLDRGETWTFTCSKQIPPDHRIGDENPIRNVATATGKDPLGRLVESLDDHLVRVLHPAIDIEKTGPATAPVGMPLGYTLTVTNPGDVPFARQDVIVADPRCEAPPAGPATGVDASPDQLDPGDSWTYTCTAQTAGRPAGTFVNTATVTGKGFNGRTVTDSDDFPTMLETRQVLTEGHDVVSGRAKLRGASGCVSGRFTATVRGRQIARVTFFRDGKKVRTIKAKPGQRTFTVRIDPSGRQGVHRVTARVVFERASRTRARTLRLSYQRCRKQVVRPRFTG